MKIVGGPFLTVHKTAEKGGGYIWGERIPEVLFTTQVVFSLGQF